MANDVTEFYGSKEFPVNDNEVYGLVETIASQRIAGVKSSNRLDNAFFEYVVDNGKVVEEAVIKMAQKQTFVKTGSPNLAPKDPVFAPRYFNNWEAKQYQTTIRRNDIRKIIANKGVGVEQVVAEILDTLTQGEGFEDYNTMIEIFNQNVGFDASTTIFGDAHPKSIKGVIYAIREMYNALKATNKVGLDPNDSDSFDQATPVGDIRILISETLLNMFDVVELANIFNLSKEELFGKLVVVPYDANYPVYKILVYDRKAFGRGTRLYEMSQDIIGKGLYTNEYLTVDRCYFYNGLFKCLSLDVREAVEAGQSAMFDANVYYSVTETLSNASTESEVDEVLAGRPFEALYTADAGYTLTGATVSVTMGGTDITADAYANGKVSIAKVTGNIVVAITAVSA